MVGGPSADASSLLLQIQLMVLQEVAAAMRKHVRECHS
jgi:hypothetical protein